MHDEVLNQIICNRNKYLREKYFKTNFENQVVVVFKKTDQPPLHRSGWSG